MDNNLQDKLKVLKLGYIKKLEGIIPEFKVLLQQIGASFNDELYSKVHTISGTSGMYGLNELSDTSTEFEVYLKEIKHDPSLHNEVELKEKLTKYIENIENIIKGENNG